ncbi:hypothetical protein BKM09_030240 [Pseudomonas amygdali pv. morsprunorum]|nr:hypothetical protein BKM09_030240 [Pseudomonas amygdali pv. morsprunorum]
MLSAQDALVASLKQSATEQMLADHLSLEGFDYVAAMYELSRTLATLALLPSNVDPLATWWMRSRVLGYGIRP